MTRTISPSDALLELAERCEAATGPDALLDLDISQTTKAWKSWPTFREFSPTASVDVALTLVPENHAFNLDNGPCHWICLGKQKPMGRVDMRYPKPDYTGDGDSWLTVSVIAATPALAICAASLRARAASNG